MRSPFSIRCGRYLALLLITALPTGFIAAQADAPAAKPGVTKLEILPGTKASYRSKEQLAGLSFPNDAVGSTETVTGTIVIGADGAVDSAQSKLSVDLRTLKSDQDMRDGYVRNNTLETMKFPYAEFVPKKVQGLPNPIPAPDRATNQAGFQLTGDLTIHGVTKEVTFNGYATFSKEMVSGRAWTEFTFADYSLTKPKLARLLSVDDKIGLELEIRMKRSQ